MTRTSMITRAVARFLREDEDGATAIEYGLIAALIAVAIIGAVGSLSDGVSSLFSNVEESVNTIEPAGTD